MASFPTPRTTLLTAGASALVATGLWVASGFVNHFLLVNVRRVPTELVNLVAPRAMDFGLTSGDTGSAPSRRSPASCWRLWSQA